jgi:hypothetical protein
MHKDLDLLDVKNLAQSKKNISYKEITVFYEITLVMQLYPN